MEWIVALLAGGIVGAASGRDEALMFALGATLGWLFTRVLRLQRRLKALESATRQQSAITKATQAQQAVREAVARTADPARPARAEAEETAKPLRTFPAGAAARSAEPSATPRNEPHGPATAARSFDWHSNVVLRWLLTGNVPVKVGVLVSFFGIAFLFKHAVDQEWVSFPIQVRLVLVAIFGVALLGLGWRLRRNHRVYALNIQGGGIGVLYLVAYAALRLFNVLPAGAVFIAMSALAVLAGWLAVTQSARQLAVLGSVGGFLAPILASTGSGSHVALFTYYLLLNVGIAGVAYYRHWRMLNLLGFLFTFGIGLAWGAQYYDVRHFASVEPFLVAYFLLYTAIAVLAALRQPFRLQGYVDSTLVFGLPLVAFPLQVALVDGETQPLAWSATLLALFYLCLAKGLAVRWPDVLRLLVQVYIALGVIFATLAVPLWLDGTWVSNTWALEAAAMIFIGVRQRRALTHWGGVGLMALALGAYLQGMHGYETDPALLNERFIGGFMLCVAFSACAWVYTFEQPHTKEMPLDWLAAGGAWAGWLLLGTVEIFQHAARDWRAALALVYLAAISVLLERAANRYVPLARVMAVSLLPLAMLYALWWFADRAHPLAAHGWLAWPLAFTALGWIVHAFESGRRWLIAGSCWLALAWLAVEVNYQVDQLASARSDWDAFALLVLFVAFTVIARKGFSRAYPTTFDARLALWPVVAVALLATLTWNVGSPSRLEPIPYLPLVNLVLIASVAVCVTAWQLAAPFVGRREQLAAAAALTLLFVTAEIARATTHFAGVPFNGHALWHSGVFQAALSICWSMLGIGAMVAGASRAQRMEWMAGAALMGVVVLKLFAVDLNNTGSVTRIVSFIGVGLLLLAVGHLAPVPATKPARAA